MILPLDSALEITAFHSDHVSEVGHRSGFQPIRQVDPTMWTLILQFIRRWLNRGGTSKPAQTRDLLSFSVTEFFFASSFDHEVWKTSQNIVGTRIPVSVFWLRWCQERGTFAVVDWTNKKIKKGTADGRQWTEDDEAAFVSLLEAELDKVHTFQKVHINW